MGRKGRKGWDGSGVEGVDKKAIFFKYLRDKWQ